LGYKNTERYFSSGSNIEEIGHESNLSANVAFLDSFNLSLPNHIHGLIPADGPPRRVETEEAKSGIDSAFYESVILLDDIIEIFALAQLSGDGQESGFENDSAPNSGSVAKIQWPHKVLWQVSSHSHYRMWSKYFLQQNHRIPIGHPGCSATEKLPMAQFDLFFSYASADLAAAEALEAWLQAPPRNRTVWRDRRSILPAAPDYYPPILAGISASAAFLLLLSSRWLRSQVAARELADAQAAGKKIVPVIHPAIPRDPTTSEGRESKSEMMQTLQTSGLAAKLERLNWIWLIKDEFAEQDYTQVEQALATDFEWAARHAVIVQRLNRWKAVQDVAALLRGADLVELMADAFADAPNRVPVLTAEQRAFLLESQRHDAAERERMEGLYWGAQSRAAAFAARERGEAEPDVALLLAAEGASIATAPESRASLLSLLHRHALLTGVIHGHGWGRIVSGVTFSRDGRWLASVNRARALGDDRRAHLLVHDARTGQEWERIGSNHPLSAVAWGERWLAVASPGSIGWLRWDDWKGKFRGNTPTALDGNVIPDYLAFSPPAAGLSWGEVLAWGTKWGDIGLIRVGDHVRWQGRLNDDRSSNSLTGLSWLADGRLITAEGGRILARPFPGLEPAQEIAAPGQVFSLASDGERWVASCSCNGSVGLLVGKGTNVETFLPAAHHDLGMISALAGQPDDPWFLTGSSARRSGAPAVALWKDETVRETLLQGEDEGLTKIAADPSGRFLAAGDMQGRVWLWDRNRRSYLVSEALPGVIANCIVASRAGRAAVATRDGHVLIFGPSCDGAPVADVLAPFTPSRLLSADSGRMLLATAEDGRLAMLGVDGVAWVLSWLDGLKDIAAAADASIIAVLGLNNVLTVLRLTQSTLYPVRSINVGAQVIQLALDPTGQWVYAVVERLGFSLVSWRVDAPDETPVDVGGITVGLPPTPIAFPGEGLITIGDGDDLLFLPRDAPKDATRRVGHDEPVRHIAAGSHLVASVACWFQDTRVDQMRLWTTDGQPLGPVTLPEHAADIALSPDENSVLMLGQSGSLWRVMLRVEDWVDIARRIAGRSLTAEEERRYGVDVWQARSLKLRDEG
jgi:WD40 repeat protein